MPVIIYIDRLDDRSSSLYTSPQIEAVLGYPPDRWLAEPDLFVRRLHPDDRERVLADIARSNSRAEPLSCEYRMIAKDGRVVWFLDASVIVRDEDGQAAYAQGYLLDITERKRAEQERVQLLAKESEARREAERLAADYRRAHRTAVRAAARADELVALLQTIVEQTSEPLAAVDIGGRIRFANSPFADAARLPGRYQDRSLEEVCPHLAEPVERLIVQAIASGEPQSAPVDALLEGQHAATAIADPVFARDESVVGITLRLMPVPFAPTDARPGGSVAPRGKR